jgi:hypothetical protein
VEEAAAMDVTVVEEEVVMDVAVVEEAVALDAMAVVVVEEGPKTRMLVLMSRMRQPFPLCRVSVMSRLWCARLIGLENVRYPTVGYASYYTWDKEAEGLLDENGDE